MGSLSVTSDADGLAENVGDGVTGFVVPRRESKALAEKIALLAKNSDLRKRFGLAGMDRVRSLFTIEKQLDAWEEFYRELL